MEPKFFSQRVSYKTRNGVFDMTLDEICNNDKVLLTPKDVATALGIDEQGLRVQAHACPERLGFPIMITGRNGRSVRIPRLAFIRWAEGK